ncbi:hypothetical protein GE21DRAFT_9062 [Neurospora crassa]|uniref:Ureidoglycolate hydrolase n=1 Tax=Neurospora crassa (strain ATCC 24698 / 74-OR23-1A / CBS 708.71 / DSM 1257 / FGSC 987) TaxID=367110 RepID=Q7RW82_NEUCR|nr:hypothetical protein NCU03851 [Neurospora crassa OR74A]EAA26625.2 hypothetical protein NCU03851 [Neurospora crassa OR74A]KHE79957.1 hypothetical protein GE21DRAFT_9062 [Neurospora crassa]|eukprot:XP_955861.2 hypothetical protein NCU03851 [Neurospora crassa OR74A]
MKPVIESVDAISKLEHLSGVKIRPGENPYDALIQICNDHPAEIQSLYASHRLTRNLQQQQQFLSADFKELIVDPVLLRLERPSVQPGFRDPRHCLVVWARPPEHILKLASHLQTLLQNAAPNLWLMPTHRMHMTTLELAHSQTSGEIASLVSSIRPAIPLLTNLTFLHRVRLVRPMISYDLSAIAVSFVPAAEEHDGYTYHHLRRDLFEAVKKTGVEVRSRYVVPSAHITLGRYLDQEDHATPVARQSWIRAIEEINEWLETQVWDAVDGEFMGEWIVGQEKGLEVRDGTLWYGGGRTIMAGEGF